MLQLIVDENITFAQKAFNQFGDVTLLSGRDITNKVLSNADILIVRSITKVNEELLKNTKVKFVGTATIGTDHIDLDYLKKKKIAFADAKGCNAFSVAEYVVTALLNLSVRFDFKLSGKSIGVVGAGNVGSKVAGFAKALGMNVLLNDPPLKRNGDKRSFVSLDEILSADIITLHTPLNLNGVDKTFHLFDKRLLNRVKGETVLINSSRGAVINNKDLLDVISKKKLKVVLDVWENEPNISPELLEQTLIATPHIAGYSLEGKINGTKIIYESLCRVLGLEKSFHFDLENPSDYLKHLNASEKIEISLNSLLSSIYNIKGDDLRIRKMTKMNGAERVLEFDLQRKNYPTRREFNNYSIRFDNLKEENTSVLKKLRFNIIT
ncbi:MAG: 4-phosphoerythronate dehydrogenase [Ignavibacteriales bacterium]|nr:4-phosphoerythronate dehydrogenase [Ignavibacteriales bacterium]